MMSYIGGGGSATSLKDAGKGDGATRARGSAH